MPREGIVDPPYCVGREAELAHVRTLLHGAALGTGSALIWTGEPGIGKSRLLRECEAIKAVATVLSIRCGTAPDVGLNATAQLATILRIPSQNRKASRAALVLPVLAARLKRRPAAIVVDDLDLADSTELPLLQALVTMTKHHRLVVVGCAATTMSERPGASRHNEWYRWGAEVLRLERLDDPAMEVFVRGLGSARGLTNADVREIVRTAQGNPRLAIELVGCSLYGNGNASRIPASAQATVALVRNALPRSHFETLLACSVIGDDFSGEWLTHVAQQPRRIVADALQHASDLGVLREIAPAGWLAFRQIVVRKALYSSIVALKRRVLHERVVDLLAQAADSDLRRDVMLAVHAEAVEDGERAAASFARAGDRLRDDGAFAVAAEMYAHAAAHSRSGQAQWLALQQRAMFCYAKIGEWKRLASTARSTLREVDERDPAAAEAALKHLFFALLNDGDAAAAEQTATRIAALGLPNSANDGRSSRLVLAYGLCYCGCVAEAERLIATVEPENLGDKEVRLRYLIAKAEAGALVTPLRSTLDLIDEAARIALSIQGAMLCNDVGAELACRCGDLAAAQTYVAKAQSLAAEDDSVINTLRIVKGRTRIAFLSGDLAAVGELVRENIGRLESGRTNEAFYAGIAVSVGMRAGDLALVDAFFDPRMLVDAAASRGAESCGWLIPGFAEVMLARGMGKVLRGVLERCISERLIDPYTSIQLAAARYAPLECAALAVEQADEYFGRAIAPAAEAHIALCKAALLRRHRQHIAAAELAGAAAGRFHAMGWRIYEATSLELAGKLRAASRVYKQCGANSDVMRLAAGETRKIKYAPFGARLSPREHEVARLVAAGRSNRDVARALEISVRTVEHHVDAAFSKLGLRARWQLMAEMLEPNRSINP